MSGPFGVELPDNLTEVAPETSTDSSVEEASEAGERSEHLGEDDKPEESRGAERRADQPEKAGKYLDLDKLERFRFGGKEWRPKDLQKAILRHQDYTRKTTELSAKEKNVEAVQKYADNFDVDLQKVLDTPALLEQMRQIYPPNYVRVAEKLLQMTPKQQAEASERIADGTPEDSALRKELNEIKAWRKQQEDRFKADAQRSKEAEITSLQRELDAKFDNFGKKYPDADAEVVNNRALAYVQKTGKPITDAQIEVLFKQHDEQMRTRYTSRQKSKVEEQRKANQSGRDSGPGGGTPGSSPGKVPLKKVKDQIQSDIDAGRFS